ncbi:MAG: C45 family peptidase [Melioribacteraceae bacterium]
MKFRFILIFLFLLSSTVTLLSQTSTLTQQQKDWLEKANRHEKNGWIYVHIEGAPEERGFQHGYLTAKEINESLKKLSTKWKYQSAMEWQWLVQKTHEILTTKVDEENLAEIDGMVEGMKAAGVSTSRDELVALNGYMELIWYWWPTVKDSFNTNFPPPKKEACSSFIATGSMTSNGKIVLGHNSMVGYEDPFCNIVLDIVPEKGHRILMQAFTGFIHSGTDFFVTDAGLVGSETTIGGFYPFDPNGAPEFSRMRHATQYANSIDEWCDMMKKDNNGGYANAWLLGDIKTNEIARLELGLKQIGFEKKKDGYFTGSNIAENLKLLRFETKSEDTNIKFSNIARRVRWKQLMKENAGKINLDLAKYFVADHYDPYLKSNTLSQRMLCAHWEYDPQLYTSYTPFSPEGALDGKVVDAAMAKQMSFIARWGSSCGTAFDAKKFLEEHPQYDWMSEILKDRPSQPWTIFRAGEK